MKILVSAESFGYGPITTGLNIVKELRKQEDCTIDFIGSGIALEQAKMSKYFNEIYECDTNSFESLRNNIDVFKSYDIYLSAENVNGAIFALQVGQRNTYYLDNLMWMWDKIPDGLNNVKKYFISEIISCKENFKRIGKKIKNPIFVGPIRKIESKKCKTINQLLINIGGAESFLLNHKLIIKFYNKLINDVLSSKLINKFSSIIICGGSGVLNNIVIENKNPAIKKVTLTHDDYLKELEKSEYCIFASGLGNFIESVGLEKNIMYLPAINYSQLQQIEYYKDQSFGFKIINWPDFDFYKEIPKYLDEEIGVNLVVSNIENYLQFDYSDKIQDDVSNFLNDNQNNYFKKRNEYISKFEKNAAKKIAKIIIEENIQRKE